MSPSGTGTPAPAPDAGRRRRSGPGDRTTPRSELSARPRFTELSPEVGVLDHEAFDRMLQQDPDLALALLAEASSATDEQLRAAARALAAMIVLDRANAGTPRRRGIGRLHSVPWSDGGDLDLDASLLAVAESRALRKPLSTTDLTVRQWGRPTLALCLLVDASGSMGGSRLAAAALTAAACAWRAPGDHAVLAFARQVRVLRSMNSTRTPAEVVDAVLKLRGHGVTALANALREAGAELEHSPAARRVVVLLSDCRATDDADPVPAAAALPELLILAPADDSDAAADLAARAGVRWAPMRGAGDAPAALLGLLEGA